MFRRVPIVGNPLRIKEIVSALSFSKKDDFLLKEKLRNLFKRKFVFLTGSGISAFYIILEALKKISSKREVILPAYTAPLLILAVKRASLKPVLCDISLESFQMDLDKLSSCISSETLCILVVHMFGLAQDLEKIKNIIKSKEIFIIEDVAQAWGTTFKDKRLGTFGDISFFSLNRGKNLTTYNGGIILTDSSLISSYISSQIPSLNSESLFFVWMKLLIFSVGLKPWIYSNIYPLSRLFKTKNFCTDFKLLKYNSLQANLFLVLLKEEEKISRIRFQNGMFLLNNLKGNKRLFLPHILKDTRPVFNRFPVVFKEIHLKERIKNLLLREGIESSILYPLALHQIFDLGYSKEDFPVASYFSQNHLTLPTNPFLGKLRTKVIEIFKNYGT